MFCDEPISDKVARAELDCFIENGRSFGHSTFCKLQTAEEAFSKKEQLFAEYMRRYKNSLSDNRVGKSLLSAAAGVAIAIFVLVVLAAIEQAIHR